MSEIREIQNFDKLLTFKLRDNSSVQNISLQKPTLPTLKPSIQVERHGVFGMHSAVYIDDDFRMSVISN